MNWRPRATDAYEGARGKYKRFLNAGSAREIVFVRGATGSHQPGGQILGRAKYRVRDEVVLSHLEIMPISSPGSN